MNNFVQDILEECWKLIRNSYHKLLLACIIPSMPFVVLAFLYTENGLKWLSWFLLPVEYVCSVWLVGTVAICVVDLRNGLYMSPVRYAGRSLCLLLPLTVLGLVLWFVVAAGVALLILPGLLALAVLQLTIPIFVMERPGMTSAIKRSFTLSKGYRLQLSLVCLSIILSFGPAIASNYFLSARETGLSVLHPSTESVLFRLFLAVGNTAVLTLAFIFFLSGSLAVSGYITGERQGLAASLKRHFQEVIERSGRLAFIVVSISSIHALLLFVFSDFAMITEPDSGMSRSIRLHLVYIPWISCQCIWAVVTTLCYCRLCEAGNGWPDWTRDLRGN